MFLSTHAVGICFCLVLLKGECVDLVGLLRRAPLFQRLSPQGLALVAGLAEERSYRPGMHLIRQADIGATFFLVAEGEAIVQRVDEHGFQRPVGMLRAGDSFGITSLFVAEPRDATVTARTEMRVWIIRRGPFQGLLQAYPRLRRELLIPKYVLNKLRAPRLPWQAPSELIVYYAHRHWIVFARALLAPTLLAILILYGLTWLVARGYLSGVLSWAGVLVALGYGAAAFWRWIDWRNDYFAVSNRRICYRERVALFYEARNEVPLDRVQNINLVTGFWGKRLGYGTLTVQTAADAGSMVCDHVPRPEEMRDAIWEQSARLRATLHATERWKIRQALAAQMGLDTESEEGSPDEIPVDMITDDEEDQTDLKWKGRLASWMEGLDLWPKVSIETPESVTWRKHWIFFLRSVSLPLLFFFASGVFAVLGFFGIPASVVRALPIYPFVLLALTVGAGAWLWWEYSDWGNDLYIVTDERIIDIEKRPLSLSTQRREASLAMIQNVQFEIPNFWASLWNYGNVIVQTAGAGDFTFDRVPNPRAVQNEIFRRMQVYRDRLREQEAARRRRDMAEWFTVYEELRGKDGPASPRSGDTETANTS